MEQLTRYIKSENAVLVVVLYCIGRGLKALKKFPNQLIPVMLTVCGVALACLSVWSRFGEYANWAAALFDGVAQGVLCTGMAVYANEVITHCGPDGCSCKKDKKE